jgi:hypothetical protein
MRFAATIVILLVIIELPAQGCFDFHKTHCKPEASKFTYAYNKSSVSYLFKSGESRNIPFELLEGKDYRMTICTDPVFSGVVWFRIITGSGKELYDNSKNNYDLNVEFTCKKTEEVDLIIMAPKPATGISDTIVVEGCIGLLIEDMVSFRTGF